MVRHILHVKVFAVLVVSIVGTIAGFLILAPNFITANPTAIRKEITIAPGTSSRSIARQLARERIIRNPLFFQLTAHFYGASRFLQAGTYEFSGAMSLRDIVLQMQSGRVVLRDFVVPEGLTISQIGKIFENEGLGTAESFGRAVRNPVQPEVYRMNGLTLEGHLFPNTYKIADGTPASTVVKMMVNEFERHWTYALDAEAQSLGFSAHQIVTLASIIEKEAKVDEERELIAAVFHNRLRRGWKLEADPTVLYALGNPQRLLTRKDLKTDSPYNTYLYRGLPPGPICNPGMPSILAALRPVQSSYLYFVAIGGGQHHFSTTLSEHNRIIRKMKANLD